MKSILLIGSLAALCAASPTPATINTVCNFSPYSDSAKRHWEYILGSGEPSIPDYYIDNSLGIWYGTVGVDLWTEAPGIGSCGSKFPAWMRNRTMADGSGQAEMCVQTPEDDCFTSWNIEAITCGTTVVYKLLRTAIPDSAYCTGFTDESTTPPSIPITPVVSTGYIPENLHLMIYCDFTSINHPLLWYQTLWYVNGQWVHTNPIQNWSVSYRNNTALSQTILESSGIRRMGFDTHCQVRVRGSMTGSIDSSVNSEKKFLGLKADDWSITVANDQVKELYLEATAPIACRAGGPGDCKLHVGVHLTSRSSGSYNPDAYTLSSCGTYLQATNDGSNSRSLPLRIRGEVLQSRSSRQGITKFRLKTATYHEMGFWRDIDIGELTVTVKINPTVADGKYCTANNDPHMITFDGRRYQHQTTGVYMLYNNTRLPIQVQMGFQICGSASCGNALAVRVGRTVFRIYRWASSNWRVYYASCESDTLQIKRSGRTYMMYLPTGAYMKVTAYSRLDVWLYPTSEDVNSTSGLCGTLNGDCADDFTLRDGSRDGSSNASRPCNNHNRWDSFSAFSNSWRVTPEEDLFNNNNLQNLKAWHPQGYKYCTCKSQGSGGGSGSDELTCSADLNKSNKNKVWDGTTVIPPAKCFIMDRSRRSVEYRPYHSIGRVTNVTGDHERGTPLQTWDETGARDYCNSVFNKSAAIKACATVIASDAAENLESCVFDIQHLQSTEMVLSAVEASKTTCLQEAMMDVDLQNETEPGTGTILDQVSAVICPFDCSGHGVCNNGTCDCDTNFGAEDCSVKLNDPPVTYGLSNDGYCDVMIETCEETSVFTEYIDDSRDVRCRLIPFTLDLNNLESGTDTVTVEPRIESFSEAVCSLPSERQSRSTNDPPSSASWKGYRVAIANDGVTFSKGDIYIMYNSECQRCTIVGDSVKCEFVVAACISNGACIKPGEFHPTIPCYKCDEQRAGVWAKDEGDGCVSVTDHHFGLWIIGAVVGGVVLCAVALGLACLMIRKGKRKSPDRSTYIVTKEKWNIREQVPSQKPVVYQQ